MVYQRFYFIFLGITVICFPQCNNPRNNNRQALPDSTGTTASALMGDADSSDFCFINTTGNANQDSSFLHLSIKKDNVYGTLDVVPYEKDARRGALTGTKKGDLLDLNWVFTQEGIQDTLRLVFKFDKQDLLQKPLTVNERTGRQVTLDSSKFTVFYSKTNCDQ